MGFFEELIKHAAGHLAKEAAHKAGEALTDHQSAHEMCVAFVCAHGLDRKSAERVTVDNLSHCSGILTLLEYAVVDLEVRDRLHEYRSCDGVYNEYFKMDRERFLRRPRLCHCQRPGYWLHPSEVANSVRQISITRGRDDVSKIAPRRHARRRELLRQFALAHNVPMHILGNRVIAEYSTSGFAYDTVARAYAAAGETGKNWRQCDGQTPRRLGLEPYLGSMECACRRYRYTMAEAVEHQRGAMGR
ncbi:hypothetical protein [Allokutzneria albata]|uniref:Uncharacterized protein n=1 Tax=Allokutzneria albata TaxID=211114 RepID=A0A1G9SSH8_ALLAB|nr:hypothetical protein [Allokutzneria albata]SDM38408.1 hypothetical protein SAMN04489726_1355 [Allokutzneria albata]